MPGAAGPLAAATAAPVIPDAAATFPDAAAPIPAGADAAAPADWSEAGAAVAPSITSATSAGQNDVGVAVTAGPARVIMAPRAASSGRCLGSLARQAEITSRSFSGTEVRSGRPVTTRYSTDAALPHAPYVMKGVGPFTHTNPQDRPKEIFGGKNTLHFSGEQAPYVLLPIIPASR